MLSIQQKIKLMITYGACIKKVVELARGWGWQGCTSLNKNLSWSWSFLAPIILPELELELFSSNYSPRAGAVAFRLQFLLPELELKF